jgi:hypothetical protein
MSFLFYFFLFYSIFLFWHYSTVVSGRPSLKVWWLYAIFLYYFSILTISPAVVEALSKDFFIFLHFWRARIRWPLLFLSRLLCIFERCLESSILNFFHRRNRSLIYSNDGYLCSSLWKKWYVLHYCLLFPTCSNKYFTLVYSIVIQSLNWTFVGFVCDWGGGGWGVFFNEMSPKKWWIYCV